MENPAEAPEKRTNLEAALLGQVKDNQFATGGMLRPIPPFDDLRPQDRLECGALASAPNHVLWGKYLVCQTISSATNVGGGGIKLVVTDPKGSSAMELCIYNYSSLEKSVGGVDLDDVLPPASFLVLKNPSFKPHAGRFMLLCDNPAEVELVSRKRAEANFPDLEWNGELAKRTIHFFGKRHFWENLENDEAAKKLKGLGNKGFVDKRFSSGS